MTISSSVKLVTLLGGMTIIYDNDNPENVLCIVDEEKEEG